MNNSISLKNGYGDFGKSVRFAVPRYGDLNLGMYFYHKLPRINQQLYLDVLRTREFELSVFIRRLWRDGYLNYDRFHLIEKIDDLNETHLLFAKNHLSVFGENIIGVTLIDNKIKLYLYKNILNKLYSLLHDDKKYQLQSTFDLEFMRKVKLGVMNNLKGKNILNLDETEFD